MASPSAKPSGGRDLPLVGRFLARAGQAIAGAAQGAFNGWFGPLDPLPPMAPPGTGARLFDYPAGVNLTQQPRQETGQDGIDFATLRRLADPALGGLDLLRLAIETRKDQIAAQAWHIVGMEDNDDGGPTAKAATAFLRKPDGVNTFRAWMRSVLEDHFVIDAPALYFGNRLAEQIDGATLKRVIDANGRTPPPPLPAFQQYLHGIPANDYTTDAIGYYPYNPRPNRLYGMSRVEQVLGIVTMSLNRQLSTLAYFTAGTVPDMIVQVPETWNPDQIRQAQDWWDTLLAGDLERRRGAIFAPGGGAITFAKPDILKNDFDEWLARIISYAFSLSPEALVKQTNRATAETAKEAALEEGLEPLKLFIKDLMDDVLVRCGFDGVQFAWADEDIADPIAKATVLQIYVGKPIMSVNEGRKMANLPPLSDAELEALNPPPPPPMLMPPGGAKGGDDGGGKPTPTAKDTPKAPEAGKVAKAAGRSLRPVSPNPRLDARTVTAIRSRVRKVLIAQRRLVVAAVRASHFGKADDAGEADPIIGALSPTQWEALGEGLRGPLEDYARERAEAALDAVVTATGRGADDFDALLDQAHEAAAAWARDRAGALVTEIDETTRDAIRGSIADGIADGLTTDEIARGLADDHAFSDERAMLIARTETSFAENAGTLAGFRASGQVAAKQWSVSQDEVCDDCQALDGETVGVDEAFSTGDDAPPAHPNCRCVLLAVLKEENE